MNPPATKASPFLFYVLLAVMVAAVLAFVLLRPNPNSVRTPKITSPVSSR